MENNNQVEHTERQSEQSYVFIHDELLLHILTGVHAISTRKYERQHPHKMKMEISVLLDNTF